MKTNPFIFKHLSRFTVGVLIASIASCSSSTPAPQSVAVYTLVDVTASTSSTTNPLDLNEERLARLFHFDSDLMAAASYKQSLITGVHLNQVSSAQLPAAQADNFNTFKRKNKIKTFLKQVSQSLATLQEADYGHPSSSIFIPVAQTIEHLAETEAHKQVLILQSDLFENSFFFTVYSEKQLLDLAQNPNLLSTILNKETPIKRRLDHLTVYIVNEPDADSDRAFYLVSQGYKKWLESKGATVKIVANLNL